MTAKTALITGASSGIGSELARQFAENGDNVVLVARREERLRELATELESKHDITATSIATDLTEEGAPEALLEAVQSRDIEVHTLVNNAGFAVHGRFDETDLEREVNMIDLNIEAVTRLAKLFVRPMLERGDGEILNTASIAGMAPGPTTAVYAATKAYVLSFSEAIAHEFEPEGITVTALCPGPVDTELINQYGLETTDVDSSANDPRSVAKAGFRGLKKGKRVVVPSTKMKALSQMSRILPRRQVTSMAAKSWE